MLLRPAMSRLATLCLSVNSGSCLTTAVFATFHSAVKQCMCQRSETIHCFRHVTVRCTQTSGTDAHAPCINSLRVPRGINTKLRTPGHITNAFLCLFPRSLSQVTVSSRAVPCRRTKTDLFVSDLAVRWPGVRHMLALDQAEAAGYVVSLTCALAMQPYKAQVLCQSSCFLCLSAFTTYSAYTYDWTFDVTTLQDQHWSRSNS